MAPLLHRAAITNADIEKPPKKISNHIHEKLIITHTHMVRRRCRQYKDGAGNTVEENSSVFSLIQMC